MLARVQPAQVWKREELLRRERLLLSCCLEIASKNGHHKNENPPFEGGDLGDHQPVAQHGDCGREEHRDGQGT